MKKIFSWILDETTSTNDAGIETTKIVINKKARALGEFAISTLIMAVFVLVVAYSFTVFTTVCTILVIAGALVGYIVDSWKTLRTAFDPTVAAPSVAVTTESETPAAEASDTDDGMQPA